MPYVWCFIRPDEQFFVFLNYSSLKRYICASSPSKFDDFQWKNKLWSESNQKGDPYLKEKSTKLFLIFPEILSFSISHRYITHTSHALTHTNEQTSNQLTFTSLAIAKGEEEASEISKLANLDLCNFTKLSLSSHFKGLI